MKVSKALALLCVILIGASQLWANTPPGLELIFRSIEPAKPFHPFWPPLIGDDAVGTIVIAKDPGKVQALFETIESPSFSNAAAGPFEKETIEIAAGDLVRTRMTSADIAFSQLDAISNTIKTGKSAKNLLGTWTGEAEKVASIIKDAQPGNAGASPEKVGNAPKDADQEKPAEAAKEEPSRTVTGADFSKFSSAVITIPKLRVRYYTLATLIRMSLPAPGGNLSALGARTLSKQGRGWIISRVLIADSIDYELTSTTKVDAGFFAKLLLWLPTASVKYKSATTISISTNRPVVLGYKLWRPDLGAEQSALLGDRPGGGDRFEAAWYNGGEDVEKKTTTGKKTGKTGSMGGTSDAENSPRNSKHVYKPEDIGIGADEIDKVLNASYDKP